MHIEIASMRQFQHMLLKLRKPFLKFTLNKNHVHWLSSFKHLNLPISIKIPVTIVYLHDSYTTKFDFMNYAFAKLVLHGSKKWKNKWQITAKSDEMGHDDLSE